MKKKYVVELEIPEGACSDDAKDYIETAVKAECGCRNPEEDPMYNLKRNSVGIDIVPDYIAMAQKKVEAVEYSLMGKKNKYG